MRTDCSSPHPPGTQTGVTLIELVVFMVVVSIALGAIVMAMNQNLVNSVEPLASMRALECAQAKLDQISARKFDENSPTGGVPACGSAENGASDCAGIVSDSDLDDVGDFHNYPDNDSNSDCDISITVVQSGGDFDPPLSPDQARLVTVDVESRGGGRATLSTYRTNF